ncbi:helix-turn-helix transcriptional regulator [Rhizobium sp. HT1-10]|uniref:helix-turn-helix transcriptional regulator n=1 Tax=Rhizobium sp. HT1-10 TaxID=3111638 RepID=UPI003C134DE6
MKASNDNETAGDLLIGAGAIARHLGLTSRQVYRLVYDGILPHFKLGGSVSARRSTLTRWLDEQEHAAAA